VVLPLFEGKEGFQRDLFLHLKVEEGSGNSIRDFLEAPIGNRNSLFSHVSPSNEPTLLGSRKPNILSLNNSAPGSLGSGNGAFEDDGDWTGAGSGKMYATHLSDKVGIGTTLPNFRLHVEDSLLAIYGNAQYGVIGHSHWGYGLFGYASAPYGTNYAIYGKTLSPSGYAGYFEGKALVTDELIIEGNVGIGTMSPQGKLDINGGALAVNGNPGTIGQVLTSQGPGTSPVWSSGTFPVGTILMYSGTWVDNETIPGWYKCDGSNGTINLVDKFVRGGTISGATGGSETHTHGPGSYSGSNHNHTVDIWANDKSGTILSEGSTTRVRFADVTGLEGWAELWTNSYPAYGKRETTSSNGSNPISGTSSSESNVAPYHTLIFIQRIN